MPVVNNEDHSILYSGKDTFTDVFFNGHSVKDRMLVEVKVYPATGWGYICSQLILGGTDTEPNTLIDGQIQTHTYHGYIQVIE